MKTLQKAKAFMVSTKGKIAGAAALAGATALPGVHATAAIANDTLEGLPDVGSDLGSFLTNLAPGVGTFILILGIFGGVTFIVYAVGTAIVRGITKRK